VPVVESTTAGFQTCRSSLNIHEAVVYT